MFKLISFNLVLLFLLNAIHTNLSSFILAGLTISLSVLLFESFRSHKDNSLSTNSLESYKDKTTNTKHFNYPSFKLKLFQKQSLTLASILAVVFLLSFNSSYLFAQTPYGFKEFITFNGGFLIYFAVKKSCSKELPKLSDKWYLWIQTALVLSLAYFFWQFLDSPHDRLTGFFIGEQSYSIYPNVFALFLLLVIPVIYFYKLKFSFNQDRLTVLLTNTTLLFALTSLFLTSSRTHIVGFLILVFIYFGLSYWPSQTRASSKLTALSTPTASSKLTTSPSPPQTHNPPNSHFAYIAVIIALAYLLANLISSSKVYNLSYQDRYFLANDVSAVRSVDERFQFFINSLKIFNDNILTGVGPGGFQFINPRYQSVSFVNSEHPHNLFLKILAENGLLAFLAFFAWFLLIAWSSRRNTAHLAIVITLFFVNSFDFNLGFPPNFIIFFAYMGYFSSTKKNTILTITTPTLQLFVFLFLTVHLFLSTNLWLVSKGIPAPAPLSHHYFVNSTFFKKRFLDSHLYLAEQGVNPTSNLITYLNSDFYNNFKAHYLFLASVEKPPSRYLHKLQNLLQNYNHLLSINAHHTIATDNPIFIDKIYSNLLNQYPQDIDLIKNYNIFKRLCLNEAVKFDTRYQTAILSRLLYETNIFRNN